MDALSLEAIVPPLREELTGRFVTRVELLGKFGVLVRFSGAQRDLYLSAHPELSRAGLVDSPPAGEEPRPAPDNLAKPLKGAKLVEVTQEPGGRVGRFVFEHGEADHASPLLVAELIPRFANVILVGNDDAILWSARTFAGDRPRQIVPGRRYEPPAAESGVPFAELDEATLTARLESGDGPLHLRLPTGWGGGARGFVRVLEEAGLDVPSALLRLAANAKPPHPRLLSRETDGELRLFPADPGPIPGWSSEPEQGPSDTLERYYRSREETGAAETLLGDLRRVLVKRRSKAAKALRRIEERIEDAASEARVRREAELLAAHLARARRGMKEVRVPDFDGEREVTIALDPKLEPRGNLDALFKKARRLARGREELETQRAIQASEIAEVDRALEALDPPPELEALRDMARDHAPSLLRGQRAQASRPAKSGVGAEDDRSTLPDGFNPRRYLLPGGWEVWVGRNARQNDELTHRHASQKDFWFHARGCEGSHTVLRVSSGKGEPPKEILLAAAAIAAYHSKARNSKLVPVAYTQKRYVRRSRGAPPGTALMMREKVLMVEPKIP